MGSLTAMLNNLTGAEEDKKAIKERMELLLVAAKGKIRAFKDEINENFLNPDAVQHIQVPGIRAIRFIEQYHVAASNSFSQQVGDHLDKAIDAFFSIGDKEGNGKDAAHSGVKSLIQAGLAGFIGSTEGGETEERIYVVVPENNAFIRADILCWKYTLTSHKIIDQSDSAVAYLLVKSVIDHTKLAVDELIYFATDCLMERNEATTLTPAALATAMKALIDFTFPADTETKAAETAPTDGQKTAIATLEKANYQVSTLTVPATTGGNFTRSFLVSPPLSLNGRLLPPPISEVGAYIQELQRVWSRLQSTAAAA